MGSWGEMLVSVSTTSAKPEVGTIDLTANALPEANEASYACFGEAGRATNGRFCHSSRHASRMGMRR